MEPWVVSFYVFMFCQFLFDEVVEERDLHWECEGREVARGVAGAADAGADTLDGLTYSGCTLAKWAVGERRDRTPSVGNSIVALVFRLPVSRIGGTVCATSAGLAMPTKGIGYGFDQLA